MTATKKKVTQRSSAGRPLSKQIRERLAACEAVGLHYWGDHPTASHFWAVDDHQRAHVVRISCNASTAQHVCRASSDEAEQCAGATEAVAYTVPEDDSGCRPSVSDGEETADRDDLTA